MRNILSDIQALDLDDLVGGAEDTLPLAIYTAQVQLNEARRWQHTAENDLDAAKASALSALYQRPDGAGKNDRERRINEDLFLGIDARVQEISHYLEQARNAVEAAQANLDLAQNQFAAVRTRARVVAAMLEYAASSGKPLHVEAGQDNHNSIPDDDEATISSNETMPF